MDKLSTEIKRLILNYLDTKQKLKCKLVCKSWAHLLGFDLDLATLVMPKCNECHEFIERNKTDNTTFRNYKRLTISDYYDVATLVTLFPNLNFLYFPSASSSSRSSSSHKATLQGDTNKDIFRHWKDHLETFIDFSTYDILFTFLETGVFPKLTTLVLVSGRNNVFYTSEKLKNAPNLTTLHLCGVTVELESLHTHLPLLQSMVLSTCVVIPEERTKVSPTTAIKKFHIIKYAGHHGFSFELSSYMVAKYPNLKEFAFKMHECGRRGTSDMQWETSFLFLIRHLKLTSFKVWLPICIPSIYENGFAENKMLRKLGANIFNERQLLDKITHLLGLQSLSLIQVPQLDTFKMFKELIQLKVLKLRFTSRPKIGGKKIPVDLTSLINEIPTVETLSLICVDLSLSGNVEVSNMKRLKIKFSSIKSDLSSYLTCYFPGLDTLILDRCIMTHHLQIPHHHLLLVKIYVYKPLLVSTHGKMHPRVYIPRDPYINNMKTFRRKTAFDVHDQSMYTTCMSFPLTEEQCFHFSCASVKTLLLGEELVLL
ncbi:hypothetical protein K501DRAFT_266545 [Backusella circina FSU 941]|nr:hypothetical protein K501DRAFT_266545 [Backusella circina FSU 941]